MRGAQTNTTTTNNTMSLPSRAHYDARRSSPQGLTLPALNTRMAAMRSRLKDGILFREVSERKQVGDTEGMVNEEGAGKGASSEGLEQM